MVTKIEKHCTNEQCCIWKNNGKLKKWNRCITCTQQKILFKMDIHTKLFDNDLVATRKNKVTLTLN